MVKKLIAMKIMNVQQLSSLNDLTVSDLEESHIWIVREYQFLGGESSFAVSYLYQYFFLY